MRDSPPMSDELRNGFYPDFESGWRRAEVVGRIAMLLVVAATLAGLLGGGPATLWTSHVAAGALRVEFPPVIRFGTPTGLTLHVDPRSDQTAVAIAMPAALVKRFGLQSVTPRPLAWSAGPDGEVRMTFGVLPGLKDLVVEVGGMPIGSGSLELSARLDDAPALSWSQAILP
ncbi:hypothetical protein [Lichenibacterium ramalinae]|nr:hypothetical protein [Lichenibacterium ramalinae]